MQSGAKRVGSFSEVAERKCWSPRSNARVAAFDQVKVAVKRAEIDWLHIIPEGSWCNPIE